MERKTECSATVVVIDDDGAVCDSIHEALEMVGLRAEIFTRAEEFFATFPRPEVDCIVLDVRMPGMDGLAVQKRLRDEHYSIPIVFISAFGDVWTVVQAMRNGAHDFIEKPFSSQALLNSVQSAIREGEQLRREADLVRNAESVLQTLTNREREVLVRIGWGWSSKRTASDLGVSVRTIEFHRANLRRKLGTNSRAELTRLVLTTLHGGALPPSQRLSAMAC